MYACASTFFLESVLHRTNNSVFRLCVMVIVKNLHFTQYARRQLQRMSQIRMIHIKLIETKIRPCRWWVCDRNCNFRHIIPYQVYISLALALFHSLNMYIVDLTSKFKSHIKKCEQKKKNAVLLLNLTRAWRWHYYVNRIKLNGMYSGWNFNRHIEWIK